MQRKSAELGESVYSVLNILVPQFAEDLDFNYCCSTKTPHWITAVGESLTSYFADSSCLYQNQEVKLYCKVKNILEDPFVNVGKCTFSI